MRSNPGYKAPGYQSLQNVLAVKLRGMLILTRYLGQTVYVGDEVTVTVIAVRGNTVSIGINAPDDVAVHREEIYLRIQQEEKETKTKEDD